MKHPINVSYSSYVFFVGCAISRCLSTTLHPMNRARGAGGGGSILLVHYSMIMLKPAIFCDYPMLIFCLLQTHQVPWILSQSLMYLINSSLIYDKSIRVGAVANLKNDLRS